MTNQMSGQHWLCFASEVANCALVPLVVEVNSQPVMVQVVLQSEGLGTQIAHVGEDSLMSVLMADEGFPQAERFGTVLALVPFLIVMTPLVLLKVPLRVGGKSTVLTDVILFGFALNHWRALCLTEKVQSQTQFCYACFFTTDEYP